MSTLWQDTRYALRLIVQKPGFAAVVILVLGLGIGANSAIFSLLHTVLWRPLDLEDPDRLVVLASISPEGRTFDGLSYLDYQDYARLETVLSGLALHFPISMNVRVDSHQEIAWGAVTTVDYFDMLGVVPAIGRAFIADEAAPLGGHPVVVLGHSFWQSRLGGDPQILGQELSLNGHPYTVIGIAPAGFRGNHALLSYDFWVPVSMVEHIFPGATNMLQDRKFRNMFAMGRLQAGVTLEQARLRLGDQARVLAQEYPDANGGIGIGVYPESYGRLGMGSGPILRLGSLVILVLVSLVLLIACVNVANLLLARSAARRREIGVRLALGASRVRLLRQLLTESLLLALLGGVAGLGLAVWAGYLLASMPPTGGLPVVFDYSLDGRILLYTLLVTLATATFFGLGPALRSSKGNLAGALRSEGSALGEGAHGWHLRKILVVGQVAASLVILVSAGLFARSMKNVAAADVGFRAADRLRASVNLGLHG